jgi:hypothetical protein
LHDCHLIDSDDPTTDHPIVATVNLKAGLHPIRVFYRHSKGKPALSLRWAGPGIPDQPIPASALFTDSKSQ